MHTGLPVGDSLKAAREAMATVGSGYRLAVGDRIIVTDDRGPLRMVVSRQYVDQSLAAGRDFVTVAHTRPGGFVVTFTDEDLASGRITVRKGHEA